LGRVQTFSGGFFLGGREGGFEGVVVTWEDLSMEEFVMGKRISIKRAQDFLALFKKRGSI